MKISRSSWHYKLYRYIQNIEQGRSYLNPFSKVTRVDHRPPKNLCPYVWMIFCGLIGALVLSVVVILCMIIASPFWVVYKVFQGLWWVCEWIDAKVRMPHIDINMPEREPRKRRERKPSLVVAYVKARKKKVCPMIELVD